MYDLEQIKKTAQLAGQWNEWVKGYVQTAKAQQVEIEQQLMSAAMPTGAKIPGVEYGSATNKRMRIFLMGDLGTWKTTWCAQWPSPLFISIQSEGGDDALVKYPEVAIKLLSDSKEKGLLEPPPVFNVARPPSKEIRSPIELQNFVDEIVKNYKNWGIATVIIDSITYFVKAWIAAHTSGRRKTQKAKLEAGTVELMRISDWGMLESVLNDIRIKLFNTDLNVIFTSIDKEIYETDPTNMMKRDLVGIEPMIPGAAKKVLAGATKVLIWAEKQLVMHPHNPTAKQMQPIYRTDPTALVKTLRHKYFNVFEKGYLEDPVLGTIPTFRSFWQELGQFIYLG